MQQPTQEPTAGPSPTLECPALDENQTLPSWAGARNEDHSPPLCWQRLPQGARTLALIVDNPDTGPIGRTHWVIFNIPATLTGLPAGIEHCGELTDGTRQGQNDFQSIGWHGPQPRPGAAARYRFRLFALDVPLSLAPGSTRDQLMRAMTGHVVGTAQLVGTASRPLFDQ